MPFTSDQTLSQKIYEKMLILYKNVARSGKYIDCRLKYTNNELFCFTKELNLYNDKICPPPHTPQFEEEKEFIKCRMKLMICDARGDICSEAAEEVTPEINILTDRGPWSVFHANSEYCFTKSNETNSIQICTKEKSNTLRAIFIIVIFDIASGLEFARSEKILVLSKPPNEKPYVPFARVVERDDKSVEKHDPSKTKRSPSLFLKLKSCQIIPAPPSDELKPWKIFKLGSYRNIDINSEESERPQTKRPKISNEIFEAQISCEINNFDNNKIRFNNFTEEIRNLKSKIDLLENEKKGLINALKIFKEEIN